LAVDFSPLKIMEFFLTFKIIPVRIPG